MRAGGYMMSEYVASDKLADSQRRVGGRHRMSEYAPSDRLTSGFACSSARLLCPANRVQRRVRRLQLSHSLHSGIKKDFYLLS